MSCEDLGLALPDQGLPPPYAGAHVGNIAAAAAVDLAQKEAEKLKVEKAALEAQLVLAEKQKQRIWGDGVDYPEKAGNRNYLEGPPDFVPKDVRSSIEAFGHSEERLDALVQKGKDIAGQLGRLQPPIRIDPGIAAAIYAYTEEDMYQLPYKLNYACRTPEKKDRKAVIDLRHYRYYFYHLEKGVAGLATYVGTVYRGIDTNVPAGAYPVGQMICWHQFSSSSKRQDKAKDFVLEEHDGLRASGNGMRLSGSYFIIQVKTGREIERFSAYPQEEEVIIPPGTFFHVARKIPDEATKKQMLPELQLYDLTKLHVYELEEM